MSRVRDFNLIMGALQVGLPDDGEQEITCDLPHVFENLQPPVSVRAVVVIDGEAYEVEVRPA